MLAYAYKYDGRYPALYVWQGSVIIGNNSLSHEQVSLNLSFKLLASSKSNVLLKLIKLSVAIHFRELLAINWRAANEPT